MTRLRASPGVKRQRAAAVLAGTRRRADALLARAWEALKRDLDAALRLSDQAASLARSIDHPAAVAGAALVRAGVHYHRGEYPVSLAHARAALTTGERLGDAGLQATALHLLGNLHVVSSRGALARAYFLRALPLARAAGDGRREAQILANLAHWHWLRGEHPAALARLRESVAVAHRAKALTAEGYARVMIGSVLASLGRPGEALAEHRRGLAIQRKADYAVGQAMALRNIGECLLRLGRPRDALAPLHETLLVARRCGDRRTPVIALVNLSAAHLALGELPAARRCGRAALRRGAAQGDARLACDAWLALARADARDGRARTAAAALARAEALASGIDDADLPAALASVRALLRGEARAPHSTLQK